MYEEESKRNTNLRANYTNNNHIRSDNWVLGIVDLVYSVKNGNVPTQCNFEKPRAPKLNISAKHSIAKCDELFRL